MIVALIIFAALVAVGLPLYIAHRLGERRRAESAAAEPEVATESAAADEPDECCGQHAVCERDSLIAGAAEEIVYYDDDELDAFRGRAPGAYTPEETDMFRDVLLTLLPRDVAGWGRSLALRGIEMPYDIRDEFLMIVGERRRG